MHLFALAKMNRKRNRIRGHVAVYIAGCAFCYFVAPVTASQPVRQIWEGYLVAENSPQPAVSIYMPAQGDTLQHCQSDLARYVSRVDQSGGYVWTDQENAYYSFVEEPQFIKRKVLELNCKRKQWRTGVFRKSLVAK